MVIEDLIITPIAFADPPLLNVWGTHEPTALRVVLQLATDEGIVGLGEAPGGASRVERLMQIREHVVGLSVFDLGRIEAVVHSALAGVGVRERLAAYAPLEVACLDAQGKALALPVSDLLGGRVRDRVEYSAYLFYKWAGHDGDSDEWGEALDADGLVAEAHTLISEYGFRSLKLKGGVFDPATEIDHVAQLHDAFPEFPLRLDPNCAWSVETSIKSARRLDGMLEYLEDPTPGIEGMAAVQASSPLPLATNMCVTAFDDLPQAIDRRAIQIVLGDHHAWGGMRRVAQLGRICETWRLGLAMHSNSHLGISLAAMTHLASVTPALTFACDTHYPWNAAEDLVRPGALVFEGGAVAVPAAPGLGVELVESKLAELHERYLSRKSHLRSDAAYRRTREPGFNPTVPRW
ncbi:glucarate dehydratase [Microbacterium sp. STN6]|uniref:enolase C-terminal domain-like protein n=1 Tax=Microbacterium sp. STN6 TaxID=2995588 RepID=UPI002260E8BF|nr:enolase C-terminal domain-like protein [Microbacterium sp. STN6]MCX7522510.1 glucarate dehydratase [Microbacterium sp. STN6]